MINRRYSEKLYNKSVLTALGAVAAVLLPQLIHFVAKLSGTGASLGEILLPMHFGVIIAGLVGGAGVGLVAGAAAPLLSYALSGMPNTVILPFIVIELAVYGLTAGLLKNRNLNIFIKLLAVQLSGRAARLIFAAVSVYALGGTLPNGGIAFFMLQGILGVMLQWLAVPAVVKYIKETGFYE